MSETLDVVDQIRATEDSLEVGVYPKREVNIVRGEGAILWDDKGNRYVDCVGGQGVANVGHCNPLVVKAIEEQAKRLITCPEIFYNDKRAELLRKLVEVAPAGLRRVFLCNSGTEAIEASIKFARLITSKTDIIATVRSFHGRSMGALSATWEKKYREPFMPLVPGFSHVPYGKIEPLRNAITENTAAILVEPIQGEGGVHIPPAGYLRELRQLCDETGVLLILDEIQTGFCRTGKFWGGDHEGVRGDIMALAKAIGGGMPMGAVLIDEKFGELQKSTHGTTFGGNPLACAAAIAAIQFMQDNKLEERATEMGDYLRSRLEPLAEKGDVVREIRGRGLITGIELKQKVVPYLKALLERSVLALPAGPNVLRLLPPLVIEKADLDFAIEQLIAVLG
ncbi:MAG: aspartate aminotransferase family protein [Chloroflexi bacterium]|uniref:Putative [LysW]-aminoadipate semialdehyde transaminase n=1 Tax=Candidatus Chlorohelix allophototropha TaxID=3003348 RepID=A0A8T7LXP9_9CHLR|nr:aspartate aminotransferase family protein [Chloroflexota bacterium]WJW66883.1 aspartate aminotransferase family protein [Chloroflexota bacterium L227-S17]